MPISPSRQRLIDVLNKKAIHLEELFEAINNGIELPRVLNRVREPLLWEERANAKEHLTNIARW